VPVLSELESDPKICPYFNIKMPMQSGSIATIPQVRSPQHNQYRKTDATHNSIIIQSNKRLLCSSLKYLGKKL